MTIEGRVVSLEESRRWHEAQMGLLTSIAERAQATIDRMDGRQEQMDARQEQMDARLEEQRRDSQHNQRVWVWVAQKLGLPEDDDGQG